MSRHSEIVTVGAESIETYVDGGIYHTVCAILNAFAIPAAA
jgi:hypothetical protein